MKKLVYSIFGTLLLLHFTSVSFAQIDFAEVTGVVVDKKSDKPIPACNVYVRNRDIGTVANSKGEFSIKIPLEYIDRNLVFSIIGYQAVEVPITQLSQEENKISLAQSVIVMDEVVVRDAEDIIREALNRVNDNYPTNPELLTTFYREIIKKNNSYVDISQGILDVFKLPYQKAGTDRIKINKGFRSKDYKPQDTLAFKLRGGPNTMLLLDMVKNPALVLSHDILPFYVYELTDIREFDSKRHYEISFEPRKGGDMDMELYHGKIFVEQNTLAISELRFGYSPQAVKIAGKYLVKDKPRLAKLTPLLVEYEVKYREFKGRWYLYYVKNELAMRCNWKKRLFNSTFHSTSEMVVTDRNMMSPQPFDRKQTTKSYVVFSEEASKYDDDSFWENYTIIKPEDDIRKALSKINARTSKK
ncbi:MAG: carboxypeptidase-like regulatory domain-containing protein [Cyclobacteriaceae bacterium]